jgi:amino acid adenylation domain-containing protein
LNKRSISAELSASQRIKESDYWIQQLSGMPAKRVFPYDFAGPERRTAGSSTFQFPTGTAARMTKIAGGSAVRLHMLLVTAVTVLLDRYTCDSDGDIVLCVPVYKQQTEEEGRFINTVLPLRNRLEEGMSFKELLLEVRQTVTGAVEHQNYPMETLLRRLDLRSSDSGDSGDFPLADAAVLLESIHDKSYLQDIRLNMLFCFRSSGEQMECTLEYNASRYHEETVQRIANHMKRLLAHALFHIDDPLEHADILDDGEKSLLLETFNASTMSYDRDKTISRLFQDQVQRTPHHPALFAVSVANTAPAVGAIHESPQHPPAPATLTYTQLNEASNRLARYLRKQGVLPGSIVALLMERDSHMMTAIMGVIKAGAAYLPIAPETPVNRIVQMLEDAQVSLLLTRSSTISRHSFSTLQKLHITRTMPFQTAHRRPIADLDSLPMPDRSLIDYEKYSSNISLAMVKHCITMQGTRGCPFTCAYCARLWPKKQVVRSAEHLFAEVQRFYDMGIKRFALIDDIFNMDIPNSSRFFQKIIDSGMDLQLLFPAGLRGDIMTPDYIDLMVEAGTINISVALETASPRLQKLIRKNLKVDKLRDNLRYICTKHPHVILDLFTMHGLPTETEEEAMMTLDFIKELKWLHFPLINITRIYPNTPMEQLALESGITRESILKAENLPWHEAADTLPFDKSFTTRYQADFLDNYFLKKERLLHVLPFQMMSLTEQEIAAKYNSYLPTDKTLATLDDLLEFVGIRREELGNAACVPEERFAVPDLNRKIRQSFPGHKADNDALRVLLLDLSQAYPEDRSLLDELFEPPLGLMYLATWLNSRMGGKVNVKIAKSGIDFLDDKGLKELVAGFNPQVTGIRTLTFYKDFFHRTVAKLRQWGFDGPLITGGPYATNGYTALLQDANVDIVALAEGEITLAEVIEAIIAHNGQLPSPAVLRTIPGILFTPRQHPKGRKNRFAWDVIMLDELQETLEQEPHLDPEPVNGPDDPVYTIYTSGSTGMPKGVLIRHRNLHNLVVGLKERIYKHYAQPLNVALVSPYVFDASVKQVFAALLLGHTLHIVPEETRADGRGLLEFLKDRRIDLCDGTPTHLKLMLESGMEQTADLQLKHLLIGGEPLAKGTVHAFFNAFEGNPPRITNVYGPTECSVDSAAFELTADNIALLEDIPIGTPMPNHRLYIFGAHRRLQPIGVPGHLYIAGDGLSPGYLNRPELTAERFVIGHLSLVNSDPNDQCPMTNDRLYNTGDLARWLPDGNLQYLGRRDHQVKIRGFRLELGEIENQLQRHRNVKEAVVVVRGKEAGDPFLCAYIVPTGREAFGTSSPREILRTFLSATLPDYMLPPHFVLLERLPLTPNGKVDRAALPEPEIGADDDSIAGPQDRWQEQLAAIWSEILKIEQDRISIDANFFEIGGHSLKATILIARIHKHFDVKIPLARIFESPTIRELAADIAGSEKSAFIDLVKVEEKEHYPLSYNQKRLWFINRMNPDSSAYTMTGVVELDHAVEETVIREVLDRIMLRHECFRTGFKMNGREPVQFVLPQVQLPLESEDLSGLEESGRQEQRDALFSRMIHSTFDLTRPPLFKSVLVELAPEQYEFMFSMHHIVSDGWSMEILHSDFHHLYDAVRSGREVRLEPLELQYRDFAIWHNRQIEEPESGEKAFSFWKNRLENGVPACEIAGDFNVDCTNGDNSGSAWKVRLDSSVKAKIYELAAATGTTSFALLFSAYMMLLSRFSNSEEVACSIINSGREHASLHRITGFFVNAVIFNTHVTKDKPFRDFMQELNRQVMETFRYQYYPIELVLERLKMKYPALPGSFNLLNMQDRSRGEEMRSLEPLHMEDYPNVKFNFECYFMEYKNGFELHWAYNRNIYKPATARHIIDEYVKLIDYLTTNPGSTYGDYRQSGKKRSIW